jgi:hypothetical protein
MVKIRKTGNTNGERKFNGRHSVKIGIGLLGFSFPASPLSFRTCLLNFLLSKSNRQNVVVATSERATLVLVYVLSPHKRKIIRLNSVQLNI